MVKPSKSARSSGLFGQSPGPKAHKGSALGGGPRQLHQTVILNRLTCHAEFSSASDSETIAVLHRVHDFGSE